MVSCLYTCKSSWIIYIAKCKCHDMTYVGETYDQRGFVGIMAIGRAAWQGFVGLVQHFKQYHGGSLSVYLCTAVR